MKLKQTLGISVIVIIGLLFSACSGNKQKTTSETTVKMVSVDSLIALFNVAWNQHDSIAISKMFTNTTLVLTVGVKAIGIDSIMKNLGKQILRTSNFKTTKIAEGISSDIAYYAGSWTIDIIENNSVVGNADGNITAIWKIQSDNSWKIELLHMSNTIKQDKTAPNKQEQAGPNNKKGFGVKKG